MRRFKKLIANFRQITEYMGRRQIATLAAGTAFWFFLSLFPIVILGASILPFTSLTEEQVLAVLASVAPGSVMALLSVIVEDVFRSTPTVLSLSVLLSVWCAGAGFATLIRGLEEINQQPMPDGFFVRRFRGIAYTLSMIVAVLLSITLMGFGEKLLHLTEEYWPGVTNIFTLLLRIRFIFTIAFLTVFFSAIFKWGTAEHPPLRFVWPGALIAAVCWCLFSWIFSAWVSRPGSFGIYGSLATVVIVMLWIYYCQYILLLGACFNRARSRMNRRRDR